jgi:hypothetical protein
MQKISFTTYYFVIALACSLIAMTPILTGNIVEAVEVTRQGALFDEIISDSSPIVTAYPQKVYVVQITTPNSQISADPLSWYQNLYYYFVTRTGLTDIPFGYIVDRSGVVYEGLKTGDASVPFTESTDGAIIIGYLSNGSDIPYPALRSIQETVEEISYKYGITKDSVSVVDLKIKKSDGALSILELTESNSKFAKLLLPEFSNFAYSDKPQASFTAELEKSNFEYESKAGEIVTVEMKITNSGDMAWFTDKFDIYLETFSGKDSQFAVNGKWESFQKVLLVEAEENVIGIKETISLKFELQAPLLPGKNEEKFQLKVLNGDIIPGSTFTVTFTTTPGDYGLLKIKDTETGKLNVRKDPFVNADLVTDVPSGRMYKYSEVDGLWYKIEYSEGKFGWAYGKYIEIVQKAK